MAAEKPKREKTAYTILRRSDATPEATGDVEVTELNGQTVYELVASGILASNGDQAIRAHVEKNGAQEGKFVAVPARSFVETTVKVETTTVVKLGTG